MAEKWRRPKCQATRCTRGAVWTVGYGFASKNGAKVCDDWACRSEMTGGYPAPMRRIESPSETAARLTAEQA